ncbi:hypothetical protein CR162_06980 [Pseudoroseomonas rhizosphaerae]|uniref:Uncharacterized protein n=1 Tax=Teichococcus rhizosphaerae TaxID=1335062 RepID=A0A2C6ZAR1_9PROT|nr:hypothetical protein CR162_06980 [Pseudoroseomonas rhizosphaerae]
MPLVSEALAAIRAAMETVREHVAAAVQPAAGAVTGRQDAARVLVRCATRQAGGQTANRQRRWVREAQ